MNSFTKAKLESVIITLLQEDGYNYVHSDSIVRKANAVLIKDDLTAYLSNRYHKDEITKNEINSIIRKLETFSSSDLYESNKAIMKTVPLFTIIVLR